MPDFKEVSLGFAEFVSELIQETFDAILSSQNYQLERYAELESKLNLPNEIFVENFVSDKEIEAKKYEYFGFEIKKQMLVDDSFRNFLFDNFESNKNLIFNNKLTNAGFDVITEFIANLLVDEQKAILNTLINKSKISNVVVDSGEITAKLELTNLYTGLDTASSASIPLPKVLPASIDINKKKLLKNGLSLPSYKDKIDVIEFVDEKTDQTTVLIDKGTVDNINDSNFEIPNVRLSVRPVKLTESSNLYSEIKINFKTV